MDIKGPTGSIPVDRDAHVIEPATASRDSRNVQASPSSSVLLKLSPTLFKLGQILEVLIAKVERDNVLLLLQNKMIDEDGQPLQIQFRAPRPANAEVGQRMTVQVSELKDNIPKLNVIATQKPVISVAQELGQAQLKQQPLQQLFDNLAKVVIRQQEITPPIAPPIPKDVTDRVQILWRALPEASQIQHGQTLKHGIQHAGPFLEAQLGKAAQNESRFYPATDTKTNLLRIAAAIRQQLSLPPHPLSDGRGTAGFSASSSYLNTKTDSPAKPSVPMPQANPKVDPDLPTPPNRQSTPVSNLKGDQILEMLLQQTEGALQRTLTQQLLMVNNDNPRQSIIVELPLRNGQNGVDVFDIRIHPDQEQAQQGQEQNETARPWTVMMSFNLEDLGPVRAQITLFDGRVSTQWWAEEEQTVALFQQHIETLQSRLTHVGAEVNKLECRHGAPKVQQAPTVNKATPYNDAYLDEKA